MNMVNEAEAPAKPWDPYVPTAKSPWNLRRVVHLHRRAGFAATWKEIQRDLKDGPKGSIDRLLAGKTRSQGVPEEFASFSDKLATLAVQANDTSRLQAWWFYRMLFGPDPLTERLTLMWHNHFATSARKVGMAVYAQNQLFREWARAPFDKLLNRAVRDPALLVWLDAQANRKGQPNENLARELMELFTLGIGHYTETDVKEAARALTGWTVAKAKFHEDNAQHDDGEKTILKRKGRWKGDELLRMLLDHPATAERLAWRICDYFLGERVIDRAGIRALATGLREHKLDVGWAVETVLRSQAFFAAANLGNRVQGPVEYMVGVVRALELLDPSPNTLVLADLAGKLGHTLFYPPNVGGWPGGRAWITTRAMIGRANFASALLDGEAVGLPEPVDVLGLAKRHGRGGDLKTAATFFAELLLGGEPSPAWRARLLKALGPKPAADQKTLRRAVALILACPEAQLG
jgi:uncharacterized protein (DUF1800 family)